MNSINNLLLNPFNVHTVKRKSAIKKLGRCTPDYITRNIKAGNKLINRKFNEN